MGEDGHRTAAETAALPKTRLRTLTGESAASQASGTRLPASEVWCPN